MFGALGGRSPQARDEASLVNLQVKNVSDLKIHAVDQHHVSADESVHVVWRRRREHDLEIARAGMQLAVQFNRDIAVNYDLAIETGRQTVALGEARG